MKLINTDGLALIGPGSEWFWTAVSGLVLVVTFFAIYRQLRIMRNAAANEQLAAFERELTSERLIRCQLEVFIALRDGTDTVYLPRAAASAIWAFWERTGALVRRGHLDPKLLHEGSGSIVREWWRIIEPYAKRVRSEARSTDFLVNFEWLAKAMAELDRRADTESWFDDPALTREVRINWLRERLRIEESLRTVTIASPGAPSAGQRRRPAHGVAPD